MDLVLAAEVCVPSLIVILAGMITFEKRLARVEGKQDILIDLITGHITAQGVQNEQTVNGSNSYIKEGC